MKSGKIGNLLLLTALVLTIPLFGQACTKKQPSADVGMATATDADGKPYDPNNPGGRELTKEEENRLARESSYAETAALKDVYFDFDRSDLRPESLRTIEANASWMKSNPKMKVQIEGHCDERGTEEYNLALGERRATAVKNHMLGLGVDQRKLFTISYGEELPVDQGHTEDAWAKNRRAHFLATDASF